MPWPSTIPCDLACRLAELDAHTTLTADADRGSVINEWLEEHKVPAPKELPTAPEIKWMD